MKKLLNQIEVVIFGILFIPIFVGIRLVIQLIPEYLEIIKAEFRIASGKNWNGKETLINEHGRIEYKD